MALFKRSAWFTDLHLGKKNDSETHNQDCLEYVKWFVDEVNKDGNVDVVFFLGDWFDNQIRSRTDTFAYYSVKCLELLDTLGIPVYIIVGNHDMFYKQSRDVHSTASIKGYENIIVVNEITEIGDCLLVPFMVGTEANIPPSKKVKYVMGHFEFPTFLTNSTHEFNGHSGIVIDDFMYPDMVFSGHFHKRQMKLNQRDIPVWYIGNTFPHDYNDANDRERGMMFLDWDGEPEFRNWREMPTYNRIKTSTLYDYIEQDRFFDLYNEKADIQVIDDVGLSIEEADELRDAMSPHVRKMAFKNLKSEDDEEIDLDDSDFGQVEISDVFVQHLEEMDTDGSELDNDLLIQIFTGEFDTEQFYEKNSDVK